MEQMVGDGGGLDHHPITPLLGQSEQSNALDVTHAVSLQEALLGLLHLLQLLITFPKRHQHA